MSPSRRTFLFLFTITACICAIGAGAASWRTIIARPTAPHAHAELDSAAAATAAASAANLTELSEFDRPSKHNWMMATHLLSHRSSGVRVPLAGVSVGVVTLTLFWQPKLPSKIPSAVAGHSRKERIAAGKEGAKVRRPAQTPACSLNLRRPLTQGSAF